MAKKENTIPTIIDTPEALTAKIAVDVGLVVGITAAIRPIGSAIFLIP